MVLTKNKLVEIAKEMDIKGIAKLTKQQLIDYIINNPCVNLTKEECEKMKREDLRVIARKCNVLLGKKKQTSICTELTDKFKDKKKTLDDLGGELVYKKAAPIKKNVANNKMAAQNTNNKNNNKKKPLTEIFKFGSIVQTFDKPPIVVSKTGQIEIISKSSGTTSKPKSKVVSTIQFSSDEEDDELHNTTTPASAYGDSFDSVKSAKPKVVTPKTVSPKPKTVSPKPKPKSPQPQPEIQPQLPKSKKQDAQPFPQIAKETSIKTDLSPKEIVKQIVEKELGEGKSTNFTDSIKVTKSGAKTFIKNTCTIHVDELKPLSKNSGISGAGIFLGMMKAINKQSPNVVLKLWKYNTKTGLYKQLECLSAEWNIYTYIIPFMFFKNLTPCVLFPIESGTCKKEELVKVMTNVKMTNQEVAKFTVTPYIEYSLVDIFNSKQYSNQLDVRNIMFQIVYTIGAFNKMGMRHNDCHTNNIRMVPCPTNPFKICFKLKTTQVYALVPFLTVFNDFDRTSIGTPISDVTKLKNPCTAPGGFYCNYIHQCDAPVGGARDLLIVVFYMYDAMDPELKHYFYKKVFAGTATGKKRLDKNVVFKKDGNVNWSKTKHGEFLFTELNDYLLTKAYPGVDSILNDPEFLNLCFASSTMKPSADDTSLYKVYDFYNVDIAKEYTSYKNEMSTTKAQ